MNNNDPVTHGHWWLHSRQCYFWPKFLLCGISFGEQRINVSNWVLKNKEEFDSTRQMTKSTWGKSKVRQAFVLLPAY